MRAHTLTCFIVLGVSLSISLADEFPPMPSVPALSAEESLKKIVLPAGYRLELALSEPDIKEPVVCVFDGNGRLYVAEMRSYMQEIDGKNENTPVGRVSMHWSSRGDGKYDKHSVFIDKLVLPRIILPLADGLVVGETDTSDLYLYRDTNGDGVADKKELFFQGGARGGNLEHQPSGLIWCLDNWLYTAVNDYRLRFTGTNVVKEATASNGGQWGLTQDDHGKAWFINAGGERGPVNFQQPIVYGAFNVDDQYPSDFPEVWPLVGLADVQGGPGRFRPSDKTLNHFTATCGAEIFRGDRLPSDLRGDLLFAEPVGRLIRRAKVEVRDGVTYLRNAYDKSEFIRSTDPNFRPINMVTGPDGCLYIVDMYRGIIQEGNWVREGSYLRKVVQQYSLDKNIGRGRIYRLVYQGTKPGPAPHMLGETSAQLVTHLAHPNGWWRDTAQKLLILRHDKTVVPALRKMARDNPNELARLHALWTLEGLGTLDATFVRETLRDPHPELRRAAIRISETLYKSGDKSLVPDVLARAQDKDPNVVIQAMMTAKLLGYPDVADLIQTTMTTNPSRGVQEIGRQLLNEPNSVASKKKFTPEEKKMLAKGAQAYNELCFTCHGPDGKGMPLQGAPAGATIAPALAGAKLVNGHRDLPIMVQLHGLTGPVDGKTYAALMVPMASNDDYWIASVVSYIRNSFGNHASFITTNDVARLRAATKDLPSPLPIDQLRTFAPQLLADRKSWKLTASHNPSSLPLAVDGNTSSRYTTNTPQVPGMWVQIELPQETTVMGLELDAESSDRDYPRGYTVQLSNDGQSWDRPVAVGDGDGPLSEISFAPTKTKFIKITQTGHAPGLFWSIHELQILTTSGKPVAMSHANSPLP